MLKNILGIGVLSLFGFACAPAPVDGADEVARPAADYEVVGGDIMVPLAGHRSAANGLHLSADIEGNELRRWPGAVIQYEIDGNPALPAEWRTRVLAAMSEWTSRTNIRFVPHQPGVANYAFITSRPGGGCLCYVGMIGGRQEVMLQQDGCYAPQMIHELGHLIGLPHEHQRPDRDAYITYDPTQVDRSKLVTQAQVDAAFATWGKPIGPFDFASIMLYGSNVFALPGKNTMTKKDGSAFSHNTSISATDVKAVRYMYGVYGLIRAKYLALGGENYLGLPLSDEASGADGVGRFNDFEHGTIYWSPSSGAHEVHGAILSKWNELGRDRYTGYPTTDETVSSDGVGRYTLFNGSERNRIYWSPASGVHAVQGLIADLWVNLGAERSWLGYPTSDETATVDGQGRQSTFQGGTIVWYPSTGAYVQ